MGTSLTDAGLVALTAIGVTFINVAFLWLNATATRRHEKHMQRERRVEETYLTFANFMHRAAAQAELIASPPPFPIELSGLVAEMRAREADVLEVMRRELSA
jgi:hypothetical protein